MKTCLPILLSLMIRVLALFWPLLSAADVTVEDYTTSANLAIGGIYSGGRSTGNITVAGTNRMVVLMCSYYDANTDPITSATFNSTSSKSLQRLGTAQNCNTTRCVDIWHTSKANEPPAETATVTIYATNGIHTGLCGAIALSGVDLDDQFGTLDEQTGTGTQSSASDTAASGDLVLGIHINNNAATSNESGTELWENDSNSQYGLAQYDTGSGTVTLTVDIASSQTWAANVVTVNADSPAGPSTVLLRRRRE